MFLHRNSTWVYPPERSPVSNITPCHKIPATARSNTMNFRCKSEFHDLSSHILKPHLSNVLFMSMQLDWRPRIDIIFFFPLIFRPSSGVNKAFQVSSLFILFSAKLAIIPLYFWCITWRCFCLVGNACTWTEETEKLSSHWNTNEH